nr:glycosyltransferase family 39 protein [Actinomycetota bacterium]
FSLLLAYKSFREYYGYKYGLIAVVLLGFNYTFIMYNRLGLYENLVIFFMLLTLFFWQRSVRTEKPLYFGLTGLSAGCAFMAKSMAFYFVGATAFAMLCYFIQKGLKSTLRQALAGLFGASVAGIIWFSGCYLPFKEDLTRLGSSWLKLTLGSDIIETIISSNPIFPLFLRFQFLPLTLGLAVIFILFIIYKIIKDPRKINPVEIFIIFWFFSGTFFLGLLSYNPTRYYLPILPPVVLLAALGLARFGYKEELNLIKPLDWRIYLISFLSTLILSFYFFIPYIRKFNPLMANVYLVSELSRKGDFFVSAFIGLFFVLIIMSVLNWKRIRWMNAKIMFSIIFLMSFIFCFLMSHPFNSRVQVELNSDVGSGFKIYWTKDQRPYNQANSNAVRINKGKGIYSIDIGNLRSLEYFRIDPLRRQGTVCIKRIEITQPGFEPIVFETRGQFEEFVPIHHIGQMTFQKEGLQITSVGNDPYLHVKISPVFKKVLLIKYLLKAIFLAFVITAVIYFLYRIAYFIKQKSEYTFNLQVENKVRQIIANIAIFLILFINLYYFSKWVSIADYSILNASTEIGQMLAPDALIAGQGVMAVTIQNKIRHVQAPNWYEDKKYLFRNYPITHLFLSNYSGYLEWFKTHYPEVMKNADVIGNYRIQNNIFYLFEINIPKKR